MENKQFYIDAAKRAAHNAAAKVIQRARKNNQKLPVWKNSQIVFEIPDELPSLSTEQQ